MLCPCSGIRKLFPQGNEGRWGRDDNENDEADGVTPDESYLEELEEIQYLSPSNISLLRTVLSERGLSSGRPSSSLGTSGPEASVRVD